MSDGCYEIEDLDDLVAAVRQGTGPKHLDACPKCRALLASYRAFVDPPDVPGGSNVRVASEGLRLRVIANFPPGEGHTAETGSETARRPWLRIGIPWLRPVWAAGLVVLVAFAFWEIGLNANRSLPSHVLRGDGATESAIVQVLAPRDAADGGTVFSWRAVPGADAYAVVFYRADLSEVGRRQVAADTMLVVPAAELTALTAGEPIYWQLVALKSGAEIGRSTPRALALPKAAGR